MSHTVLIVDNSGSMRSSDVVCNGGLISRHHAVFDALERGLFHIAIRKMISGV
jgi:hypothetical protein